MALEREPVGERRAEHRVGRERRDRGVDVLCGMAFHEAIVAVCEEFEPRLKTGYACPPD